MNFNKLITMKRLSIYTMLALLIMMGSMTMKAQEYVPIIQHGNEWNTLDVTVGMYNTYYNNVNWFSGDTIIYDVQYAMLLGTTDGNNPHQFALLREANGKVWERLNDQTEILLYDFTANVGDTLRCGLWATEDIYSIVDSISLEHIGGVDRKKFWFGLEYDFAGDPYAAETWIEGIGSNLGLLYSGSAGITGAYHGTLCFHQNGELVWQNPDYDNCNYDAIEENMDSKMVLYPNPTKGTIKIEAENIRNVVIYNNIGEKIFETETSGDAFEYDFGDKKASLYIIKVQMSDGSEFSKRIVKE